MRFNGWGSPDRGAEAVNDSLPRFVSLLAPTLLQNQPISVVRIETTRPVFLVFGSDPSQPAYVAHIGPREPLERLHAILSRLHGIVPDLVPASLAAVDWGTGQFLHVQTGLPGTPWFRLRERLRTDGDWAQFEARAMRILDRLHAAILEVPEWRCRVHVSAELNAQIAQLVARDPEIGRGLIQPLSKEMEKLAALGSVESVWQHGDFCLNNLLVGDASLGIIDFEEFGETAVPLHDEISLGLSLHEFSSRADDWDHAWRHVRRCAEPTVLANPALSSYMDGLFVHHLVWRINRASERPTRAVIRARLVAMLRAFIAAGARSFTKP